VLELADRRGLQPRAHSGLPGPIPGWGIISDPQRGTALTIVHHPETEQVRTQMQGEPGCTEDRIIVSVSDLHGHLLRNELEFNRTNHDPYTVSQNIVTSRPTRAVAITPSAYRSYQ
jgi:hypothetical protein